MPDSDQILSHNDLLQEIRELRQEITDLRSSQADLELVQQVTTEHSDTVLADLQRKNRLIRKIFGRYLTDEVVTTLLEQPSALQLGGNRQSVSVLVADLRGFTALSEHLSAEAVIKVLNCYLGVMTDVITQYEGTINDFTGDGIMVLFGAPTVRDSDTQRAVACAIAMQLAMQTVNQKMDEWALPTLQMGIGLNTGEAVVGNIGSEKHTKYSAIGKQVNLAYRIESYTVGGQVLISESTFNQVQDTVIVEKTRQIQPKGLSQPITVFDVRGMRGMNPVDNDDGLLLPPDEQSFRRLAQALPVQYALLEGKQMDGQLFDGSLIQLSPKGATLKLESGQIDDLLLSDLKLNLFLGDRADQHSDNIYAKVLDQNSAEGTVVIHFTTIQSSDAAYLHQLYESAPIP